MRIAIAISNHNQNKKVEFCVKELLKQKHKPEIIFVMSDAKPYKQYNNKDGIVVAINHNNQGRCTNRNSVIKPFLESNCDAIIFLDGDCYPSNVNFISNYNYLFKNNDLVFGIRKHTNINGLSKPPSDILTANMDNLWKKEDLNYDDLRIASGAVSAWKESKTFNEKMDLMLTGMIGWSCNFGMTKEGCLRLTKFMKRQWNVDGIFDYNTFGTKWGYEDVAMGIDAMFAKLNVTISPNVEITHKAHNRSDGLFDHVKGKHLIMDRYRALVNDKEVKNKVYTFWIVAIIFYFIGVIVGMVSIKAFLENLL